MRFLGMLAIVATLLTSSRCLAEELSPADIENRRCTSCHAQSRIATLSPEERRVMTSATTQPSGVAAPAARPKLLVGPDALHGTVHAKLACTECHQDTKVLPHGQVLSPATCNTSCHKSQTSDYIAGTHAEAVAKGNPDAPTCSSCHGGHDILPKSNRQSRTYPLNIVKVCSDCHRKHTSANGKDGDKHVASYLESVHGRAVTQGGLAVAATCADCHGSHKVLPSSNPQSRVFRDNVTGTCGRCHVALSETFATSVHGTEQSKGNTRAPVCSDCHTAHAITRVDTPSFMLDIVGECGSCHDQLGPGATRRSSLYETYRRSYHGQVSQLGSTRAARCSDCHGSHDILRLSDPNSRLSAQHRVATCARCHPGANARFAQFDAHADFHDSKRYPLLHGVWLYFVIVMSLAFGFFGLHSVLWFIRSIIERVRHGPRPSFVTNGHAIRRFTLVDRVNHAFVIVSFFGLTLTGLPLFFSDQRWAAALMRLLGGISAAGVLHRVFALMLIANFAVHAVGLIRRIHRLGFRKILFGPNTMLPRVKDITDCLGMFRWFIRGGKKPSFDRWTYWEKFDYVAEVGGSLIIGISGLMLWFPMFFSNFLPGWMFNVATIVHGYEALLAIGFIFTIHFFNAHLRLEKFPVDDVMFTGSLPEEEFKHERGVEYERLVASGDIAKLRVPPPPRWYRKFAITAGLLAMAIGSVLVVLIILAGLGIL